MDLFELGEGICRAENGEEMVMTQIVRERGLSLAVVFGLKGRLNKSMAALLELEQILLSSKLKLTVNKCGKGCGAVWSVTSLQFVGARRSLRFAVTISAAVLAGRWKIRSSLYSCLDYILSLEGSCMQTELANLLLTKYRDDPLSMKLINKHFYSEKSWRTQNFDTDSKQSQNFDTDSKPTDMEPKQSVMTSGANMIADPLECVLGGYWGKGEEIRHPDTTGVSPRRRIRANKRARRQHRMQQQEVSSTSQYAQAQVE
ncbi:hypothetical protein NE237_016095 [Protea cynaroides]|uniref:Uncharacterized protein n=1 Tax=Protea cynaroides TaxID=273540 RepID=A0A9Q0KFB4_9MAGN|nr:hypothetical protein NE237_016095 [Protea cynaroides]